MAVNNTHPDYDFYAGQWQTARDAQSGQAAIHAARTRYLDKLSEQTDAEYKSYLKRTVFFEATDRTIQGLKGMIFRKAAVIDEGGMGEDFLDDVTLDETSLEGFANALVQDTLITGRAGIMVDYPAVNGEIVTRAQQQAMGIRPFLKEYKAESIINWRCDGGKLVEVRLQEFVDIQKDEFEYEEQEQIRVLDLNEGVYRQRVFIKTKDKNGRISWVVNSEVQPKMNNQSMDFIPFIFVSSVNTSPEIDKPPLIGLVNLNVSHYKTTADLEHGAHFTGLPTAVITGHTPEEGEDSFRIGSTSAWIFSNPDATATYLEFEGKGLESLEKLIASKESKMAALGAQMLMPQERRNEAAETAALRHNGEQSVLADIANTVSDSLNKALEIAAMWMAVEPATIELNTDFMPVSMTPQMLQALVGSWQQGAISSATLFENLQRGEIIDHKKSFDDEQSEIQTLPMDV